MPIVAPFGGIRFHGMHEVVPLPGDALPAVSGFTLTCEACGVDRDVLDMDPFDDDAGDERFLCRDADACHARVLGRQTTPGTTSFVMAALNRLSDRVGALEERLPPGDRVVGEDDTPTTPTQTGRLRSWDEMRAARDAPAQIGPETLHADQDYISTRHHVMGRLGTSGVTLVRGDARMVPMDDASVDLIVTSPPYWAQRSYTDGGGQHYAGQIGDEPTYTQFVDNLIACTRDWARVLKPAGSMWVNLGDKYSTSSSNESRLSGASASAQAARGVVPQVAGMKPKSLLGLPWRYALRCTDELGLILREEVIWSKPNGMPESVTDRCRRSHEQWFHFTKRPDYYSAVDRIREGYGGDRALSRRLKLTGVGVEGNKQSDSQWTTENPLGSLPPSVWEVATAGLTVPEVLGVDHYAAFPMELPRRIIHGFSPQAVCTVCGEGRRPVKNVSREGGRVRKKLDNRFLGKPTPGAVPSHSQDAIGAHAGYKTWHYLAGEACACTPYTDHPGTHVGVEARGTLALVPGNTPRSLGAPAQGPWREYHLEDWDAPPTRPGVVLDPFGGTGTTALVADMHGRHGVHLDLSADYLRIAEWRTADPVQRASALQVPKPPVEMPEQMALDLFASNDIGGSDETG